MGKQQDKLKAGSGKALFEISISVHPSVLVDYLLRPDGFWRHVRLLACSLLWIVLGSVLQISLNEHFPELPLYPLPLTAAFLAYFRRPWTGVLCALSSGIVYDSMTFGHLGVTSAILGLITIAILFLSSGDDGIGKHFWERCLLFGGGSVFIYVIFKLGLYFAFPNGDDVLDLVPKHLLAGTLLCGSALAPLLFIVMELVESLLRLKAPNDSETAESKSREKRRSKPKARTAKDIDEPQDEDTDDDGRHTTR